MTLGGASPEGEVWRVVMTGGQLPAEVAEFARYLRALTGRLDAGTGWYGVFALRDPQGLKACLDGLEVPPWDLVQALLQDLSAQHGPGAAQEAAARAATLYRASVTAHDAGPGSREALQDRLHGMLREQRNAARRERDLQAALSAAQDAADRERLGTELAWAHDDWRRATARTEELHARLTALPTPPHPSRPAPGATASPGAYGAYDADGAGHAGRPRGTRPAAPGEAGATGWGDALTEQGGVSAVPGGVSSVPGGVSAERGGLSAVPGGGDGDRFGMPGAGAGVGGAGRDGRVRGARFAVPFEAFDAEAGGLGVVPGEPGAVTRSGAGGEPFGVPGEAAAVGGGEPGGYPGAYPAPAVRDPDPAPAPARPRPRGARFAGVEELVTAPRPRGARFAGAGGGDSGVEPPPPLPVTPRGARFAGAYGDEDSGKHRKRDQAADAQEAVRDAAEHAAARAAAQEAVARLGRLRAEGRSGEAHVALYEAAAWPAPRLPVLAEELERAGLWADVSTLLWEIACLPPERLAAAAEALVAADREADGERLLRQSVSRPAPEVAHTAQALLAVGARHEAAILLGALVRSRTPEDVARAAAEDPATLVPLLLDAAADVSSSSHHDLAHALRAAGLPGAPGIA
ncbi:hypothetical protein [Streptomyces sp. S465]|uniref:hypothetical protein n=1 Tax=Streptomyces sp. S465 TaxID=2979468 RepID=UPI0022A8423C|nr:hypothetical protein [Streptomyces sp. S465]WAP58981.1 hypothetical protein N6H00_30695 [Streptomyces sp. S465]